MLQNSSNIYHPWLYKATPFFNFKNVGMPFVLPYANLYQQTRSFHHIINSKQKITILLNFSFHHTLILNRSHQNKIWSIVKNNQSAHIVKDTTISSSKAPKSHVKLVTHMHYDNGFELLIKFFIFMSPQLGVLGPKAQDLLIPFYLC